MAADAAILCFFKYSGFLAASFLPDSPFMTIENKDRPEGKILIVKDSFGQSVIPFLSLSASRVTSWDTRYNDNSLLSYIRENDFDMVVVLYCESMFGKPTGREFNFDQ